MIFNVFNSKDPFPDFSGKSPHFHGFPRQGDVEKGSYVALHTIGRQDDINPPEGAIEAGGGTTV